MAKRACFIASSGGHWEELMCLNEIAAEYDSFYVTEEGGQVRDAHLTRVYTVPQINRHEKQFAFHFASVSSHWASLNPARTFPSSVTRIGRLTSMPSVASRLRISSSVI